MILVILAVCIIMLVVGFCLYDKTKFETTGSFMSVAGGFGSVIAFIVTICLIIGVSRLSVIDERIAMYQEENTKIEQQIATAVQGYQQYEKDIITECAPESSMTLVALYPKLQADTLVQKQIEVYIENNKQIKRLKEKDINGDVTRWWLYFGGSKEK